MTTLLALLLTLRLCAEDSFWLVVFLLVAVLLLGLVLNFSPATEGTIWKNVGWGLFYGALLFVVLGLAFIAYAWFLAPMPLPYTGQQ